MVNKIAELKVSSLPSNSQENSSLNPVDWPSARCVAHEMLDSSLDYIQYVRNRPVWRPVPHDVRAILEHEPLPEQAQSLSAVCHDVLNYVMPYAKGNTHPRYWGWVSGEGTLSIHVPVLTALHILKKLSLIGCVSCLVFQRRQPEV